MRPAEERARVSQLFAEGLNDCEIARRTGIPRPTVREWRVKPARPAPAPFDPASLPPREYAYLLGLYLGDGCISRHPRDVYALRVFLDERYPGILDECRAAMRAVAPRNRVGHVQKTGCLEIQSYSKLWPKVFPQHGPGRKHLRPIILVPWQQRIVEAESEAFLRGLIHSDGSRFTNTVRHDKKTYAYPRYNFTSASDDIRGLFTAACDRLGIAWRQMNARNVSVARREAVERLDAFVGPKR
jgi:hypothetical protein